jgi:hypothetical protein
VSAPQHNHFTRDIKRPGACPACDLYRESQREEPVEDLYRESSEWDG